MKLHTDNKLYIEFKDFLSAGWKENTLKVANYRNGTNWVMIKNPTDKRMPMVAYDTLVDSNKERLQIWLRKVNGCKHDDSYCCKCGNPYEYLAKEPISKMVTKDLKAEAFFLSYRYEGPTGNDSLPTDVVNKYTNEAAWLNMLTACNADRKNLVKKALNLTIDSFFIHAIELLKGEIATGNINGKFPVSYQRLLEKMKIYKAQGYPSLIHKNYGNTNAAKIIDEVSEAVLMELIANPLQYDDFLVCQVYNQWASKNEYKTIDSATVQVWRKKKGHLIQHEREGNAILSDKRVKEINGYRPTQPTFLWEHDDNHIDWLFNDWSDKSQKQHYHRFKSIIVTDSFNDLVLGIAYGENLTSELVRAAYIDAMYYIRSLTGGWYLPFELKSDRWAVKELQPFYDKVGKYYKTPVGSKKRGYIEQFFGTSHFKRCLKLGGANNYTGNNITARNRGVNVEWMNANKGEYPTVQEAPQLIEAFVHRLRTFPTSAGVSKEAQWLEAWANMPDERKIPITDEQFLLRFGLTHNPTGRKNSINGAGVECQIRGKKYMYELPEAIRFANVGKSVNIVYDPIDMSRVLISGDGIRCMATTKQLVPRAMADYKTGDRTILNALLNEKRDNFKQANDYSANRKQVLSDMDIDTDTLLQTGVMLKELKQTTETKYLAEQAETKRNYNPIDQM